MLRMILFFAATLVLTYVYLYPGSQALIDGRTDSVMSDGTDAAPLPFAYDIYIKTWREHPSRLFYGAIYSDGSDPEHGTAAWVPWSERWLVLFHANFFPLEQLSTAFVASLFLINTLCMYLLCIYLGWARMVSFALAFAWAFSCYTRARAKVHGALVGIYHIPLIFLGLLLVVRGRSKRSLLAAMMAFLLAGTTAHYYLVNCVFISPLFLLFVALQPEFRANWKRISGRLLASLIPLLVFLACNFHFAVPSDARLTGEESMQFKLIKPGDVDPFLKVFYARPIDFLGGDISLQLNGFDLNPLRAMINERILANLDNSNPHERTNGIRWAVFAFSLCAVAALLLGRLGKQAATRNNIIFFLIFGLFAFWQASGTNFPVEDFNPSYWLYTLCTKIRVTSRAGINVHFALLMITGFFLSTDFRWRRFFVFPGVLALIMILDYPPLQPMPMAPIFPAYAELQRDKGPCGTGMAFPFFSSYLAMGDMYIFAQRLRGSDCPTLNQMSNIDRVQWMTSRFPPTPEYMSQLQNNPMAAALLEKVVHCVPLNWIAFHQSTPQIWAQDVCRRLGWKFNSDFTCISPMRDQPLQKYPDQCN